MSVTMVFTTLGSEQLRRDAARVRGRHLSLNLDTTSDSGENWGPSSVVEREFDFDWALLPLSFRTLMWFQADKIGCTFESSTMSYLQDSHNLSAANIITGSVLGAMSSIEQGSTEDRVIIS